MNYLYLICTVRDGEPVAPVKVGITTNLRTRIKALQTACPYPLRFYEVWSFGKDRPVEIKWLEGAFHATQKDKRTSGEWFNAEPEIARLIIELHIRLVFLNSGAASKEEIDQFSRFGLLGVEYDETGRSIGVRH